MLALFQWERSRTFWIVSLVVPSSLRHLRLAELRVVAEQEGDGVRTVVALGHRRVARAAQALRHRQRGRHQPQPYLRIGLGAADLLGRDLAVGDRVVADDALCHLAIGDRLHLERVHAAEVGDLGEGERGLLDQPHGGGLGHQR